MIGHFVEKNNLVGKKTLEKIENPCYGPVIIGTRVAVDIQ